jgi:hypothetical protein
VRFFNDLQAAQRLLNADVGRPILDSRGNALLGTDGQPQTFFGTTAEQRANPYGNTLLGQMPTSIIPGKDNRDTDRLEVLNARNGSAIPIYPVEELVLGGAVGNRVTAALGRAAGAVDDAAAIGANGTRTASGDAGSAAPRTSGGAANSATTRPLAEDLAAQQQADVRIGTTRAGATEPVTVTAESNIGGRTLWDSNQLARPAAQADANRPTLISDLIKEPGAPNSNMANAHAEVAVIQRAYEEGLTQGQSMTIVVRGTEVCKFCRSSDEGLPQMAERSGLRELRVVDTALEEVIVWRPNTLPDGSTKWIRIIEPLLLWNKP